MKAANQGYIAAQRDLGLAYLDGVGVDVDYQKALDWLLKVASGKDADSQFIVGMQHKKDITWRNTLWLAHSVVGKELQRMMPKVWNGF